MSFKTDYKFLAQLTDDFDGKIKGFAKDYLYYKNIPDDVAHISNRARAKMKQRSSSFNNGLSAINGTKSKQKHKILYNYDLESPCKFFYCLFAFSGGISLFSLLAFDCYYYKLVN